ncbi:MAG: ribonuclease III [Lachnospiraceae bacterium]|nr:ribonuclease III [Lachnospiraceae bacterium]
MNNKYPVEKLEEKIGYVFKDRTLLFTALTHSSYRNESDGSDGNDYERQEFLGDAVLELVSSDYIYHNYPEMREGEMTKLRASLVCEPTLAESAKEIGLSDHILLGRGEDRQDSRHRDSIVSDVFEALIGGIFLDSGLEGAKSFIYRFVLNDIEHKTLFNDSKSKLQDVVQAEGWTLEYRLMEESGPEHMKCFTMAAVINGRECARAKGSSKKGAEQKAAYESLKKLKDEAEEE